MVLGVQLCFLLFGTCLFSFLLLLECRKLEGYDFPVFSTKECPGNQADWKNRSFAINCTESNGYMCLPNENLTDLLEFCYIYPRILIQKDLCLYLDKRFSRVDSYKCHRFTHGCPELHYFSDETYLHPSCMEIENGCFSAEPSCKRQPLQTENSFDATTLAIILGVSIPTCLLCILVFYVIRKKFGIWKRGNDTLRYYDGRELLLRGSEDSDTMYINQEKAMFDQWKQDDINFISTKACEEVERNIRSRNLVIVAGHSGSGKSAIIQHIALKYRKRGWIVKRAKNVEDIVNVYYSIQFQKNKTICVFNNPLGKESFDEIFNDSWKRYEHDLKLYLTTAKIFMSCRNYIISDTRVTRYLVDQAAIVVIDDGKYKLSDDEKRQIFTKYTSDMNLPDEDYNEIVEVERYFPLLCKLYSSKEEDKNKSFFTKPVTVIKEELKGFRKKDMDKYCALALLVLFNDDLCVSDLLRNKDTEKKFKHTLKVCGLPKNTPPSTIGDNLDSLKDFFVKKVGDMHHFYHDFVLEVTTLVFVNDYPKTTIMYADIGFLRRRIKLGNCDEHYDPFTIFLSDRYSEELGKRLYTELFGERILDVVLNPCLRNEKVIEVLKEKIAHHPENLQMLLESKKITVDKQKLDRASDNYFLTKLSFFNLESKVSPLFALIALCHTQLSQYCLNSLQKMHTDFISCFPALCCNGSTELFYAFFKNHAEESLKTTWERLCPIHIVSVFHNYELLHELIKIGINVNEKTNEYSGWTPLILAAGNDTKEYGDYNHRESGAPRRDKTVHLLLSNGAYINLCNKNGANPLNIACQNGHDSTVQLLLSNGADINLCNKNGASPLYIACQNGHDSTVQLLLCNGADINLYNKNGVSPLIIACQNGHDSTVQLLLSNGADINLCNKNGASPLYIACQNGYDSIVKFLLSKGPDINLCNKNGASPLYIVCQNGYDSTVHLLLFNGADINLCNKNGASPLYIACQNGHVSTVQLLLSNGAYVNLCNKNGASPLYIACQNGHDSTVQLLLSKGADINLCDENEASPLYIAHQNGHHSTVQFLLCTGADIYSM